jgi:serine/threonine protein kinase/tetratricopeptide (TPR) repeat protein
MPDRTEAPSQTIGTDRVLDDLLAEISEKLHAGEPVDLEAYARRFPGHAERMRQLLPAIHALADLGLSAVHETSGRAARPAGQPVSGILGDYRILREIGRGGMGVVYEAEQISLHRRVALKVLPFAAVLDPRHLQRFKNEAQAAASLDHPNIVNVYSVGCERGVHYYAMQYVEGQTLAEVVRHLAGARDQESGARDEGSGARDQGSGEGRVAGVEPDRREALVGEPPDAQAPASCGVAPLHHSHPSADTDRQPQALISTEGSTRSPEFFRTVARLGIQAAEALEHAHQMGVVHRDIKPSNLMVESRLPLPASGRGAESNLPSPAGRGAGGEGARGEGGWGDAPSLTMTGDILGTLRYMSPEQLQAKHGVMDHRTDVYSLGLTLYELLTLQPAFPGDDRQKLIRQVMEDDPRPPRQLNKAIPADLETIIMKATAKEPHSRYATAGALADDLRRFVEDHPIQARRPTLAQRAARWSRRHYWLVSRGIAASFALLSITALVIFNAHLREVRQRQRAEQNLVTAMEVLDTVYLEYAGEGYLKAAFAGDRPQPAEEITPKTKEFLEQALRFYAQFASANRDEPPLRWRVLKAQIRMGECQSRLGDYSGAEQTFNNAISLAEKLVAEVQGPSMYEEDLARAQAGLADVAARKGNWDQVIVDLSHAIRLDPKDVIAYNDRGLAYRRTGNFDQAVADFTRALRIPSAERNEQTIVALHNNRGLAYLDKGNFDEAIADYDEAIRLSPANATPYMNRANSYAKKGQFDQAMRDYDQAIRVAPKEPRAYINRAISYAEKGQFDQAMRDCDQAITLDPKDPRFYLARAGTRARLGEVEEALSDIAKALEIDATSEQRDFLAWFLANCEDPRLRRVDRALELAKLALKRAPKHPAIWTTVGAAEYRAGRWQAAVEALEKSSELKYYNVARTGFFRAMAHWQLGEKDQARQCYQQAAAWMEKNRPWDDELRRFGAEAEELMGMVETHHGDTEATEKSGRETHHGDTESTEKSGKRVHHGDTEDTEEK